MGLFEKIQELQEKPESARRRIAVVSAGTVTVIIGVLWLGTMTSGFGLAANNQSLAVTNQQKQKQQVASPLEAFGNSISSAWNSFAEKVSSITASSTLSNRTTYKASSTSTTTPDFFDRLQNGQSKQFGMTATTSKESSPEQFNTQSTNTFSNF